MRTWEKRDIFFTGSGLQTFWKFSKYLAATLAGTFDNSVYNYTIRKEYFAINFFVFLYLLFLNIFLLRLALYSAQLQ